MSARIYSRRQTVRLARDQGSQGDRSRASHRRSTAYAGHARGQSARAGCLRAVSIHADSVNYNFCDKLASTALKLHRSSTRSHRRRGAFGKSLPRPAVLASLRLKEAQSCCSP